VEVLPAASPPDGELINPRRVALDRERAPSDTLPPLEPLPSEAFSGRCCLVTGGLGFIGSNLALWLAREGARVTVVDVGHPRHGANPHNLDAPGGDRIRVLRADLSEPVARAAAAEAEIVFNTAGQVSHVDSMRDPLLDLDVNTRSHVAMLEELRDANPDAIVVYTSTRQLLGKPRYLPVDEEHPVAPVDVNGITKYATEQFHLLYGECYGLRATVVRLTNVYGPRQRLRDDFQGFLPTFVRRALLGESIRVFGDGAQVRDCLYVDDVVECLVRAAIVPEAVGEVFSVGNDEHLSLREIAEAINAVGAGPGGLELVPWPAERDAIDIGSYFGDSSKAKRVLGWTPSTRFAEGIERTMEFYRRHLGWYL
jgi:UDP-glucose 4-epimerase